MKTPVLAPTGVSVRVLDGVAPDPVGLIAHLPADAVLLNGRWAGGGALVAVDPIAVVTGADDPWRALAGHPGPAGRSDTPAEPSDDTVGGGWFGGLGFSAAASRLGYFPNVLRYDRGRNLWFDEALLGVIDDAELEHRRAALVALLRRSDPDRAGMVGALHPNTTRAAYEQMVERTQEHIRAGDIYQANICLTLEGTVDGDPGALAARLLGRLEPPYGAYLASVGRSVISASPELFLRRRGRQVVSSPIKGTRPRPIDAGAAEIHRAALSASAKERAENVMIVDLVRNDLARVAETGSVRVLDLLRIEPHPGVWHLVSDVGAQLRADADDADLLRAAFPPGSVTGTPKLRARQIIESLETSERGLYTGAIGYQSPVAGLELSVAIRTVEIDGNHARLGVGAGITAGSDPAQEWQECVDKADPIAAALGTFIAGAP